MRTVRILPFLAAFPLACTTPAEHETEVRAPSAAPALSESQLTALIDEGRSLLDAGKPSEAEAKFARAAASDHGSLRTRMWVLRAWMEQGRSNDTLDALDALDRAGEKGPEMNYLYGMAFARRAEGYIADGVTDSSVQNNFLDAATFLGQVTKADPERYHDAFLPLARSAWYMADLETARWAADRAVEIQAGSPEAWLERGRIAMSEFSAANESEPDGARAQELLADATASFQHALSAAEKPADAAAAARLAEAATQLGHAYLWQKKAPEATEAYATAIAWNPEGFDYGQTLSALRGLPKALDDDRPSGFRAALEGARALREEQGSLTDPAAATLLWWLGWARFADADWNRSEEAFQSALALQPAFVNAWFYVGLARQYRKDSEGALAAMHTGWDSDPATMVSTAAGAGGALRGFEGLMAWCAEQEPARNLDAAFLAEMLAQAMPNEPRHWNNLGLFLRDAGEELEIQAYKKKTPKPDAAVLSDLYNRAYRAYQRALELNPGDPQLVNDTALMLHYHLETDPAEVERLYRHALELADALLAGDLGADDRARYEQTEKDIAVNLKALLEPNDEADKTEAESKPTEAASNASPSTAGGN